MGCFAQLELHYGEIYMLDYEEDGEIRTRLLVPMTLRKEILFAAHNAPVGGHFGIRKTIEKLRSQFH